MNKCANTRIKNPIKVIVLNNPDNKYVGQIGYIDDTPNSLGLVRFCSESGQYPYQWNYYAKYFKPIYEVNNE